MEKLKSEVATRCVERRAFGEEAADGFSLPRAFFGAFLPAAFLRDLVRVVTAYKRHATALNFLLLDCITLCTSMLPMFERAKRFRYAAAYDDGTSKTVDEQTTKYTLFVSGTRTAL